MAVGELVFNEVALYRNNSFNYLFQSLYNYDIAYFTKIEQKI